VGGGAGVGGGGAAAAGAAADVAMAVVASAAAASARAAAGRLPGSPSLSPLSCWGGDALARQGWDLLRNLRICSSSSFTLCVVL
jgi:hypothetical protein